MNLKELENYLLIQTTFICLINLQEFDRLNTGFHVCRTEVGQSSAQVTYSSHRCHKTPACIANLTVESKRARRLPRCKANSGNIDVRCSNTHVRWAVCSQPASCLRPGEIIHPACTLLTVAFSLGKKQERFANSKSYFASSGSLALLPALLGPRSAAFPGAVLLSLL